MFGIWLGIPLGLLVFFFTGGQLIPYFHDVQAGSAAAAAAGLCVWFLFRGIDVLNDLKLDNPEPFNSHDSMPLTLGKIHEFLKEAQFGPHNWQIRTLDTDETRIMAVMKFQEFVSGVLPGGPSQLNRSILLNVYLEPKDKTTTGTSTEEKPGTQVRLKFLVDSPLHRSQVNQIITDATRHIQELVGAKPIEIRKAAHPMMPPQWLIVVLICSLLYGVTKRDEFDKKLAAEKQARDKTQQEMQEKHERLAQDWQKMHDEQQRKGYGISPNNPFTPALGGDPAQAPGYESTEGANNPYVAPSPDSSTDNSYVRPTPPVPPPGWNQPGNSGGGYNQLQPQNGSLTIPQTNNSADPQQGWRASY